MANENPKATAKAAELAARHNIPLETIQGTGSGGSIKLSDVKALIDGDAVETFEERVARASDVYGDSIFQNLAEPTKYPLDIESTGWLALDKATDAGGFPARRTTEVWGPEASGKTILTQNFLSELSLKGQRGVFFDVEHKLDVDYLRKCIINSGGNPEYITYVAPLSGSEVIDMIENKFVGHVRGIVVDSVCSLASSMALNVDNVEDRVMADNARLVTAWMNRLRGPLGVSGIGKARPVATVLVGTNQVRVKFGAKFGDGLKSAGGARAWIHQASLSIKIGGSTKADSEINPTRTDITAWVTKNSIGCPTMRAEGEIVFGMGIDRAADLLKVGPGYGTIIKKESWYYVMEGDQEVRLAEKSGFERARLALWAAPELLTRLRAETHARIVAGKKKEDE